MLRPGSRGHSENREPLRPPLVSFANWPFTHLPGTPDAHGLTEQERADAEGGGGAAGLTADAPLSPAWPADLATAPNEHQALPEDGGGSTAIRRSVYRRGARMRWQACVRTVGRDEEGGHDGDDAVHDRGRGQL